MRATVCGVAWRPAIVRATSLGATKNTANTRTVVSQSTTRPCPRRRMRNLVTTGVLARP